MPLASVWVLMSCWPIKHPARRRDTQIVRMVYGITGVVRGDLTFRYLCPTIVYSGNVWAIPSWIDTRGRQPRMVYAAVQSQGHNGMRDFTRYGVSGTERFSN